jgi:uncharacterized membrane protein HdeD (DUF308 family)
MQTFWLSPREVTATASRYWWMFLIAGVCSIAVAFIIFRFDWLSVLAIGILFGCIAISAGLLELGAASVSTGGWKVLRAVVGIAFLVLGVLALFTPGNTFVALAALVSFFFAIAGAFDVVAAIAARDDFEVWWLQLIAGIAELGLGFWAAGYWSRSVVLLIAWIGASMLFRGMMLILLGFKLHALRDGERIPVRAARAA